MLRLSILLAALVFHFGAASTLRAQDTTPPVTAVVAPADNSYLSALAEISGTASDDVLVTDVQAAIFRNSDYNYWNGVAWTATESWLTASFAAPNWTYGTMPPWVHDTNYTVISRAVDSSANWSVVYSTSYFRFDNVAPVSGVTAPANNSFPVSVPSIAGTASDSGSYTAQVWVKVRRIADNYHWNGSLTQWTVAEAWNLTTGSTTWTYSGLPEAQLAYGATYYAVARAADLASNVQAGEVAGSTFVYQGGTPPDLTAPDVAVLQPAHLAYLNSLPLLHGTAADNVAVGSVTVAVLRNDTGLYWDGSVWGAAPAWLDASLWPSSWTYTTVPAWLDASSYTIVARSMDTSSNWSAVYSTSTFIYDITAPQSFIVQPQNGQAYSSATLTGVNPINGTASDVPLSFGPDQLSAVQMNLSYLSAGVTYYWDGVSVFSNAISSGAAWTAVIGTSTWRYPFDGANWVTGKNYTLLVRTIDFAGNVGLPAVSTFTISGAPVDASSPTVVILTPAHLAYLNSLPLLHGTAADNVAVASVTVSIFNLPAGQYWNGSSWAAGQAWLDAAIWPSSWTYTNVPAWVESSSYVVTARAGDAAGNWSVVYATNVFTYDLTAPLAAITAPVTGTYATFLSVQGTASDLRGVAQVQVGVRRESDGLYWNGAAWAAGPLWNNSTGTASWIYNGIVQGDLASNTTYLFLVRAADLAGNLSDTGLGASTFTFVVPAAGALSPALASGIGVSSITINWGSTFGAGTTYYVNLSSWSGAVPFVSSAAVFASPRSFTGLTPDTSYYGFVSTDAANSFIASGFGVTLASAPTGVDFSSIAYTSATLVWSGGANPADTLYEFSVSTDSAFGTFTSSGTGAVTSYDFTGLNSWTQYYGRVRAVNREGVKSAYTPASFAALTQPLMPSGTVIGLTGSALSVTTISWNWSSGTVVDSDYFSLYSGASVFLATVTYGVTGSYEQSGLAPNSPRMVRVRGRNGLGEGPLTDSATVYTLAAVPASAAFSAVGYSSATLGWASAGNSAGTVYEYELSESNVFATFVSSGSGTALNMVFTGLLQGATYYGRVRAVNGDLAPTAYVSPAGPAITSVLLPSGLVSGLAGSAVGVSSIVWTWNSGTVASADGFALYDNPGVSVGTAAFVASAAYTQAGLGPNTANILRVAGSNNKGEGPLAASATVYTLALAPAAPAVSQLVLSSAALTLGLGGNPAGTELQLWRSADNISFENVYEGALTTYSDPALAECSPFYYKARARNGAGVYTAFSPTLSFTTMASTPAAPGGFYAEALDGARIALAWEPSPSLLVSGYRLYYDNATGTVDYNTPLAVFTSTETAWTTPALAAGSTYKFALRAAGNCGSEEKNVSLLASAQAVGVLSGVRAAIKVPLAGKRVKGNSVTIVAEVILGQVSQVAQVRFQYTPSGAGAWADITAANVNHPNPDLAAPYFVHLDADALGAGTYDLRAVATDIYGVADPAAPAITIVVDPVDFDTSESVSAGEQRKEQKINNTVTSTVQAADDATALVSKVVIPSGAVSDSTAALTLVNNPAAVPAPPAGSDALNLAVKVNLSNGQSQLAAGKTAALTFSYKDDDNNGIVDGTLAPVERLKVYTVPDSGGAWTQLATSVDRTNKTITGVTTHFSFFSVFAAPTAGLSSIKVYPVPWQPGAGGRFDAAGVTFSNLPATARIKIYTITGELVRLIEVTSADGGLKVWDGRNSEGHKAASGIYLAFIKSGSDERTLKVAVER